jgi:hypothetical protein
LRTHEHLLLRISLDLEVFVLTKRVGYDKIVSDLDRNSPRKLVWAKVEYLSL